MKKLIALLAALAAFPAQAADTVGVHGTYQAGDFKLAQGADVASVFVAPEDFECVRLAAHLFAGDVARVTGHVPTVTEATAHRGPAVLIGTLGESPLIDRLVAEGRLEARPIAGKWESFLITTVDGSLVVAGSDRRGTAYGVFELSQADLASRPWYWWADVTPTHRDNLFVSAGTREFGPPSVQYRGIFLNDEDWGLAAVGRGDLRTGRWGHRAEDLCENLRAPAAAQGQHPLARERTTSRPRSIESLRTSSWRIGTAS